MSSSQWREHQAPQASVPNPGSASLCWERSLKHSAISPRKISNLCSFPVSGHAPLGISLQAPADFSKQIDTSPFSGRHLIDGILREIEQVAGIHQKRRVPWLNWSLPQNLLDSAEVTELMYHLGRRFQLGDVDNRHYNIVFRVDEVSESKAALFKGLGFNSLEVCVNAINPASSKQIIKAKELTQDFHFSLFGIHLSALQTESVTGLQQLFKAGCRPNSICLATLPRSKESGDDFKRVFTTLRDNGYRVLGNDCFIDSHHPLADAQNQHSVKLTSHGYNCQNVSDILGMGPGNYSSYGDSRHYNPNEIQDYLSYNFSERKIALFPSPSFKPIFDYLLCYHQLDLKYFQDRYGWDLQATVESLWSPLEPEQNSFFSVCNDYLSLSPLGILHLSSLCDALLKHTAGIIPSLPAQPCVGKYPL